MMDIAYGLLCLHANNIVHRDIKSANVLINNNRAKISDFGTARKKINTQTTQLQGTLGYVDPWLYFGESENDRYTEKSDIYSLGNVLWELLNEQYQEPWNNIYTLEYKQRLIDKNEKLKIPDKTPTILKDLLLSMWEKQRNKRPNITIVFDKISKTRGEFQKNDPYILSKTMSQNEISKPTLNILSNTVNTQAKKTLFSSVQYLNNDALEYFLRATDQNLASAQYELSRSYLGGTGAEKDAAKAVYWCLKAAEQGYAAAQYSLGSFYSWESASLKMNERLYTGTERPLNKITVMLNIF